ncbi:MAG: hypothetical protein JNL60_08965 [Bacteroidia bacterium]|nr:hypothetical protein [Bacteroidia bacterium]
MKKICILFALVAFAQINGQTTYFHSGYSWDKTPKIYVPTESEKKSNLIVVHEKRIVEIAYDSDGQAVMYETFHRLYHVNNAKAVDLVNKGYMSTRGILEEVDLRARCITPEGKVVYFNTSTIKHVDNLEGKGPFKIYAVDGVETGCDVEIIHINKKQFHPYAYYYLQSESPTVNFEMRLISPKNLVYDVKTYNGLSPFKTDTSDHNKNQWYLQQSNIEGVEDEKYSADKANYMGYVYQLSMNTDKKKSKMYTWDIISREYYTALFTVDKSQAKIIEKVITKNKIDKLGSAAEKIGAFDSFLKTDFEINSNYDELELGRAVETRKIGNDDAMRFYIAALKFLQIPFELVLTSPRNELKFDPKFPSYIYTREYMFYFPELNLYVSPLSIYSRLGFPDPTLQGTEGLFIREVSIGEMFSSTAKTKTIGTLDYKKSSHNMNLTINIDAVNKTSQLNVVHSLQGYSSYYVQPVYRYLDEEQKKDVHKNYFLTTSEEGIKNIEVLQTSEKDLFVNPMLVKYTVTQNDFLEIAGNKLILKVGLAIGPQSELYQEEKRKSPGDIYYTHLLERTIEINVPEGYKAINLEDLKGQKTCLIDSKEMSVFKTSYELNGNKILVHVYEDYQALTYPMNTFEDFKAVINAAADFNKKTIVFEKI